MNKKDEFLMQLKYETPALAIEQLIERMATDPNVDFRNKGPDHGDYDEWIVWGTFKWNEELYSLPASKNSEKYFSDLIYDITGVYPRFADYQDHNEIYYEFAAPMDFEFGYPFREYVAALEELLKVAGMKEEMEDLLSEKLLEKNNV